MAANFYAVAKPGCNVIESDFTTAYTNSKNPATLAGF